jgi:hypothetical protein
VASLVDDLWASLQEGGPDAKPTLTTAVNPAGLHAPRRVITIPSAQPMPMPLPDAATSSATSALPSNASTNTNAPKMALEAQEERKTFKFAGELIQYESFILFYFEPGVSIYYFSVF